MQETEQFQEGSEKLQRELEDSKNANEVLNGISADLSEKLQQANDALAALKLELNEKESVNKDVKNNLLVNFVLNMYISPTFI